jgi:hypothetical protein
MKFTSTYVGYQLGIGKLLGQHWLVVQAVNFLDMAENEGVTPQSYLRVKEGSGVGKRLANRIADIGIVEEQVLILHGCWRCFTSERCECEMVLQRARV